MAHVLLPCDLPNWNDIQRLLAPLKLAKDADQLIQGLSKLYELCSISLEPEEGQKPRKDEAGTRFDELKVFLEERLLLEEKNVFFNETLPNMVSQALCLRLVKPSLGFFYSLKRENESFEVDRTFVKSLLANAFFSTFPKRTQNTHPFLQNFAFSEFFHHLHRRSHQKKLKAFFRYFHKQEPKDTGSICFSRKVLTSGHVPSLPAWLCSDRPLVPLLVRHEGNIHDADASVCRVFPCTSLIGGDVLQAATSPESSLFFAFPELMCCLSFVEKLEDNEALLAVGVSPRGIHKNHRIADQEVNMCFVDSLELGAEGDRQFEDRNLLRELNKTLAAFGQKLGREGEVLEYQRRQTPVGESSSSEQQSSASSRRASIHQQHHQHKEVDLSRRRSSQESTKISTRSSKKKNGSYLPLIDTEDSTTGVLLRSFSKESNTSSVGEFPKLTGQVSSPLECLRGSTSSSHSSTRSMKTASESSVELPPIQQSNQPVVRAADEEYYTADEESEQEGGTKVRRRRRRSSRTSCDLPSPLKSASELPGLGSLAYGKDSRCAPLKAGSKDSSSGLSASSGRTSPSRRSASAGFVLGGTGSDDEQDEYPIEEEEEAMGAADHGQPIHERLEDFRKRICRRTRRHLSRKMRNSLRSSYSLGSSTSSDMEDISEEEVEDSYDLHHHHLYHQIIRAASSEPSLVSPKDIVVDTPPYSPSTDIVVLSVGGRRVLITASNGFLKAYSYDGVNPNLPVPFRAKFRTRRKRHLPEENTDNNKRKSSLRSQSSSSSSSIGYQNPHDSDEDGQKSREFSPSDLPFLPPVSQWMDKTFVTSNAEEYILRRGSISEKSAAVVGPSRDGDRQLRALILWLAASMAELPALIFYTGNEPLLCELGTVYRRVLSQQWTVGDLACEILRFCRNKLSPRQRNCATFLFEQLLSTGAVSLKSSSRSYSQYSLD